jgi:hypothetical protein
MQLNESLLDRPMSRQLQRGALSRVAWWQRNSPDVRP